MTAHDLDDEGARVGRSGGRDRVDGFADAVKGGGGTWRGEEESVGSMKR